MTWVWFLILGVVALANHQRIAGWVSGWQQETLKSVAAIGLIFFGAMALFGNSLEGHLWLLQIAAAAGGILALFTINEQVRRSSAVEAGTLQRAIDQRKTREREAQHRQSGAVPGSPAGVAELLAAQARQREQPPPEPEESADAGRYVVIQVDEGDNVRGVAILGGPETPASSGTAFDAVDEADEPASPQPPPLMPVDEPAEAEEAEPAEEIPGEAAEPAAVAPPRPSGPVSLGGSGALRPSGPVKLGASVAPQASGPVSLRTGGVAYQPQVDRSRLAPKPAEAAEPADEVEERIAADNTEGAAD